MSDLIKMSDRTVRKPCKRCGTTDLYWGKRDGNFILVAATPETRAVAKGAAFPVDDSIIHTCADTLPREDRAEPEADEIKPETVHIPVVKPEPAPTVPSSAKDADALDALRKLLAPEVRPEDVRAIVKSELEGIAFPTRTIVITEHGDRKPVGGATHAKLADVTTDILAGEHVLMVGPAGTGKSTIAEQCAEALGLPFYAISLSPQTSSSQVIGYMQAAGEYVRTLFREAYENGGLFHFDEFDNGHPSVLALVNAALANGHMAFPDGMVKRHDDFRVIASANTYGRGPDRQYVGRQALDAATLDRFSVETIDIDTALERQICLGTGLESDRVLGVLSYVYKLRDNAEAHKLPVVISPRASVGACRLLKAGRDWKSIVDARMRRGLSDADWSKLSSGAPSVK